MMSADQRFMVLLACSLVVIVAVGAVTARDAGGESAGASAAPPGAEREVRAVLSRPAVQLRPHLVLRPLLTTNLADRFSWLALEREPAPQPPILTDSQVVSYYGSLYTAEMGILGTADLETIVSRVEEHAARYDALNGPTGVVPALHVVYAVAQPHPTSNGLYLQYVDDADMHRLLHLTEERKMLLFLDLQIGRSSVEAELEKVRAYLRYPQVHLAIDPEFAVGSEQVPGVNLGSLRAADIDKAQAALQEMVREEGLPPKLLIVHQFTDSMVEGGEAIQRYPDVELIVDMDGFGLAAIKRATYQRYATRSYASRAAIKLFFDHDPDLMSEEDVLDLVPRPAVVIYQ
ncbi:MAG: hypothetical protein A2148_09980 [Chloroflexi bacterium RBG_16_68_14]|nr:MAG: hypothetical protein A2148_09980 [Chloroflexi bacterium RBG_16_68_14]